MFEDVPKEEDIEYQFIKQDSIKKDDVNAMIKYQIILL